MSIAYTVQCRIEKAEKAAEWLNWLRGGHIADVLAGGAESAEIVQMDREPGEADHVFEIRYRFASRETYEHYIAHHAPALRAEGLKRFPPEDGFSYKRSVGEFIDF
jgi:hypothetical protein